MVGNKGSLCSYLPDNRSVGTGNAKRNDVRRLGVCGLIRESAMICFPIISWLSISNEKNCWTVNL
jgi:hypothetical protein